MGVRAAFDAGENALERSERLSPALHLLVQFEPTAVEAARAESDADAVDRIEVDLVGGDPLDGVELDDPRDPAVMRAIADRVAVQDLES